MRILGIDPGLRSTGFGVIQAHHNQLAYITSGTIKTPSDVTLAQRLKHILDDIREVAQHTRPDVAAIEKVFVNINPASTLLLGQARGAAMCALADSGLSVYEYTALQIKKSLVGNGHAAKEQVQHMVQRLLSLNELPGSDSADALACAICHAHTRPLMDKLRQDSSPGIRQRWRSGRITDD